MKLQIVRLYQQPINEKLKTSTLSEGYVIEKNMIIKVFKFLELAWRENKRNISCIPEGKYLLKKRYTKTRGKHFHVTDVKNRSYILIHSGNKITHTEGCILPGTHFNEIEETKITWVKHSKKAMKELNELLPEECELEIKWRT